MKDKILFTSESVSEGHPDKLCDQISDAILDACLAQDPYAHVACEVFATTQKVVIGGEISGNLEVDYEAVARGVIKKIGYTHESIGIGYDTCDIDVLIHSQSADIAQGVVLEEKEIGAGDQGIMFGFACDETDGLMPLPIVLAHKLVRVASEKRKSGEFKYARPDMKSQVTIDYSKDGHPVVDTVVMSIQHDEDVVFEEFKQYIIDNIINEVLSGFNADYSNYKLFLNPTGKFVIGGPHGDAGLTGRKIIVDTYGGYSRHGGGAFSGKDATKVDRSAAYAARYIAKNIVAAKLSTKCEVQLSYAIGVTHPTSILVETFGTNTVDNDVILKAIKATFDLTPKGIIESLGLRRPIYGNLAAYGHIGRSKIATLYNNDPEYLVPWEKTDKVEELLNHINK